MCSTPYKPGGTLEFGCGKCDACLLNRSRLWQGRLLLESTQHRDSLFVTLTYDEDHLPADGSLVPRDVVLFLKRLRKRHGSPVRYYAVGEYGSKGARPHYHLILFGEFDVQEGPYGFVVHHVTEAWTDADGYPLGFVHVGFLTPQSAGYIVGYIVKHLTRSGDPELEGKHPEFARMSRRPGVGAVAVSKMAASFVDRKGAAFLVAKGDVAREFQLNGKTFSLGRYLSHQLRKAVGWKENMPSAVMLAESAKRIGEDIKVRKSVREQHKTIAAKRVRKSKSRDVL